LFFHFFRAMSAHTLGWPDKLSTPRLLWDRAILGSGFSHDERSNEVIQRLIPGRHSQTIDWIASSFGVGIGIMAVIALERLLTPPHRAVLAVSA
jgi:hypothetical protein